MSDRINLEYRATASLKPNDFNSNVVSPENEEKLRASIDRFGFTKPIVCRELPDGQLEILGGEHRWKVAGQMSIDEVPIVNLGRVDDKRAREICLVDNGRYGADDAWKLADILKSIGDHDELLSFMPFSDAELASVLSSTSIDLDDLEIDEDEDDDLIPDTTLPQTKIQTHQLMRFKVPVEDAERVQKLIERTMKTQGYTESDSLTNAGDALVFLLTNNEKSHG